MVKSISIPVISFSILSCIIMWAVHLSVPITPKEYYCMNQAHWHPDCNLE